MSHTQTVKIKDGTGFRIINMSDFKVGQHELCEGEKLLTEPTELNGLVNTEQFDLVTLDLAKTKEQLATAQSELIAFKNDIAAMQARIDELQPAIKKPTAAEVKAAKAAEEAAKAEQPKE